MMVTFVELGSIKEKVDVDYFGSLRRQTVKNHKTDLSEEGRGRRGKNSGELNFELGHLICLDLWYGIYLCHPSGA
jgi:hypothetical protein